MSLPDEIRAVDQAGLGFADRQREVARMLAQDMGAEAASITTVDPATLLTTRCELWGADKQPWFDEAFGHVEYASEEPDPLRLGELIRDPGGAATLHAVTGGDLASSARWRSILGALGVTDELRCVLIGRGNCWGTVNLYRSHGAFTPDEVARVRGVAAGLVEVLRRGMLEAVLAEPALVDRAPGLVRVAGDGVEPVSPEAGRWLEQGGEGLVGAIRQVVASAQAGGPTDAIVPAGPGLRFHVHFTRLDGRPAALIEVPRPHELAERIVRAWGLSPRERGVLSAVLRGRSTDEAAQELGISPWTVQDHLKSVFDKSGFSSRREIVAALFSDHALPELRHGSRPSPYGWFLGAG